MTRDKIPREDLLDDLRALAEDLDHPPAVAEIRAQATYNYHTYHRRFGGLTDALEAAGIEPDPSRANLGPEALDQEALLDDLRRLGDQLGRRPTLADVDRDGRYSQGLYYRYFDSFTAALAQAGFTPPPETPIPRAELVDALQELADELGKPPIAQEMADHGRYSRAPYRREFGDWWAALEAAGIVE